MSQEPDQTERPKPKRQTWYVILGVPALAIVNQFLLNLGMPFVINPFFGINIMLWINIWYYRKTIKAPLTEFILTLPLAIIFIVASFPADLQGKLMGPALLFVFGGTFGLMAFLFLRQEGNKRDICNVMTVATVLDNEKKYTTRRRPGRRTIKTFGAGRAYSYSPVISYYANGEEIEATYGNGFPEPIPPGTEIEILYDSENPETFCFANEEQEKPFSIMTTIFLIAGGVAAIGAIFWIIRTVA